MTLLPGRGWLFVGFCAWCVLSGISSAGSTRTAVLAQDQAPRAADTGRPDVVVVAIPNGTDGIASFGSEDPGNTGNPIAAFSIGTTSCNIGDAPLSWVEAAPDHPVIRQNMYRLLGGRFEQIGTSWVKHGFLAVNEDHCGGGCDQIGPPFDELRPHCSDPYSSALNGDRTYLGPTYEINAFTGDIPHPHEKPSGGGVIRHRLQIRHSDLNPAFNPGAEYFAEGHYIHAEDAAVRNAENNASHRQAIVTTMTPQPCSPCACPHPYCITPMLGSHTQVSDPAIRAWKFSDNTVRETDARVPGEGLFILAQKTTDLGGGSWRYEYALYNLNSHLSAGAFRVPLPEGAMIQNVGFHDVDYHSGEFWDSTDWPHSLLADGITWATTPYESDPEANALRWGTLYNFRFDADVPPGESFVEVDMFRPGFPNAIAIRTTGPALPFFDCNRNGISDACDMNCGPGCDLKTCGRIPDCNGNDWPDDCDYDCNKNGAPDDCDIRFCPPNDPSCGDCDLNELPDECDPDCDVDGLPDACEPTLDADDDGFDDCVDNCPFNTPPNSCNPPEIVMCRFASGFCVDMYLADCTTLGGTAVCGEPPEARCKSGFPCPQDACRHGCRIGDLDWDGDLDLSDLAGLQRCFSGQSGVPPYIPPDNLCRDRFDFDDDADVDSADYAAIYLAINGP